MLTTPKLKVLVVSYLKFLLLRLGVPYELCHTVMKRVILMHIEGLVDFQMNTNVLQQRDTP